MKKDDAEILREVQKNTEMGMKAIDTISNKVYDDSLAMQLSKQMLKYSNIHNNAVDRLIEGKAETYKSNRVSEIMLSGGIQAKTLMNTSTGHIAELIIQGSTMGITSMTKAMNHHNNAEKMAMEIANELVDFEQKNIERMKSFL